MSAAVWFGHRSIFFWGSASYRESEMVKLMRINDGLLLSYEWSISITPAKALWMEHLYHPVQGVMNGASLSSSPRLQEFSGRALELEQVWEWCVVCEMLCLGMAWLLHSWTHSTSSHLHTRHTHPSGREEVFTKPHPRPRVYLKLVIDGGGREMSFRTVATAKGVCGALHNPSHMAL